MSTRATDLQQIEQLHADLALRVFAWETKIGHHLSYVRVMASPTVAGLLAHTGQMEHRSMKRATDTGLFMYELITHGLDSERGRVIVGRLNEMHGRWKISQEDYLWVLGTFVFMPCRAIDSFGWRKLNQDERETIAAWYRELGTRMGIESIPETYAAWSSAFDRYEREHLRPSDGGLRLMEATWDVALMKVPERLHPFARRAAGCLVDEPARSALGIKKPSRLLRSVIFAALRLKAIKTRRQGPPARSWFVSGQEGSRVYPGGYELGDLGPDRPDRAR